MHDRTREGFMMYRGFYRSLAIALAAGAVAGCGGTTSSGGASTVAITDENEQSVTGNLCAISGHATNVGNLTVNVTIDYQAQNSTGAVIGTSKATFQIAPFSNFDFSFTKGNSQGQPSSGAFSNNLSCSSIASFKRTNLDVST
jgi:hypothetical protein